MRKGLIKAAVLSTIFLLSIIIFSKMTNHVNEDMTTEMPEATLPVISLYENGTEINELRGYTEEMNAAYMRDTITPIGENRRLPICIQTYQAPIDAISYEIRSLDASRLIADAEVTDFQGKESIITAELEIQNLLEAGEEYLLILQLQSEDKLFYYYTRIVEPVDAYVDECVQFALDFNEKTFDKQNLNELSIYMEKTTGDTSTLNFVSLNSSLKQVGWGDFNGEKLTEPVPSIKEITSTYSVIVLDYVVAGNGEGGESEYYNVEEYYRVRYTSNRIYLLNFERTMNQIFRGDDDNIKEQYINLGIRSGQVEYKNNEAGTTVAFVQEGELWSFNETENTLTKVFSFRGYEGIDSRENYGEHEIKIVGIDEAGSMDYIVYGYMNRGNHEGQVGMTVYHYDSLSNANEEVVFIPTDKSATLLKAQLGQLMYVNEARELFLMLDGTIYGVDLVNLEIRELVSGLTDESFAVSESNRYVAWVDGSKVTESSSIQLVNLSNQKIVEITAGSDEYVKPLGFMKEDFVYGVAKASDVFRDAAGNETFPMYQIKIMDLSSEEPSVLKTYEKEGYYVSGIELDDYTMYLNRIQYNGVAYVEADQDMIMDREGDSGRVVDVYTTSDTVKKTEVRISLAETVSAKKPKLLTPKETILEEERNIALKDEADENRFYVYVKGDVLLTTDQVTEAVRAANDRMGVVVGDDQKYVWKRSRKATQAAFQNLTVGEEDANAGSIVQCMSVLLQREGIHIGVGALIADGETPKSVLISALKEAQVLDLTGCSVEEVLYYVSCGNPVFAMTGSDSAVLITGYDSNNIFVFDPAQNKTIKKSMSEADELFVNAGSVFFSYLAK
ncbi:MAG: hypothetical protein J6C37_01260 [Roseburia sp.]|nr:hypothetical protein [Roseburia sp.]